MFTFVCQDVSERPLRRPVRPDRAAAHQTVAEEDGDPALVVVVLVVDAVRDAVEGEDVAVVGHHLVLLRGVAVRADQVGLEDDEWDSIYYSDRKFSVQ